MVPAVMVRSTPSTARKPRKSLVSPDVCSSGTADFRGPCTGSTPSIQPSLTCEPQKSAGHTWWLCERLTDHDMEELKTPPCASEPHQIAIINVGYPFHCHVLHGSFEALRRAPWPVFGWLGEAAGAGAWPLHAGRFNRLRLRVGHELSVGQRLRADGILQQAVEQ